MAKFNQPARGPKYEKARTHEGGAAVRPTNPLEELRFTAAVTFVGEDTFYERADDRLARLQALTHEATQRNPAGVADLVRELRDDFKVRGAALVVAAEYVKAYPGRGPLPRHVVAAAMQRADEPSEFIAYWHAHHGRSLPAGVKKGLGDSLGRLVNQKSALKWDSKERQVRLGDVVELTHPVPFNEDQSTLFRALLDERHWGSWDEHPELVDRLPVIKNHLELARTPEGERRQKLREILGNEKWTRGLGDAGFTWERLSSWLPGGMDAEAWEAIIPNMGVFALIRNLRNFDQAGISEAAIEHVIAKVTSAEDVAGAKVMPMRTYQAYQAAPSDNWKRALGKTLDLASGNVPSMDGSLLLIDTSGSMAQPLSKKSKLRRLEAAALQAVTLARRSVDCDVVIYGALNQKVSDSEALRGASILNATAQIVRLEGRVGHATMGHTAIAEQWNPKRHKRAILFTDDQQHDSLEGGNPGWFRGVDISHVPEVITFDIGGYGTHSTWGKGRMHVTGLSDQIFSTVARFVTAG